MDILEKKYDKDGLLDYLKRLRPEYIIQYLKDFKILELADVKNTYLLSR